MGWITVITSGIGTIASITASWFFAVQMIAIEGEIQMAKSHYWTLYDMGVDPIVLVHQNISITLMDIAFCMVFAMFLITVFIAYRIFGAFKLELQMYLVEKVDWWEKNVF